MKLWLKFIVVWLVALVLPVQGMASLETVVCGLASHQVRTVQVGSDWHGPGGRVHGADAASHVDGLEMRHMADHAMPADTQRQGNVVDIGQHKCSACASCCSGYAILSAVPRVQPPELLAARFVAVVPAVAPFATDGPDRPPRFARV